VESKSVLKKTKQPIKNGTNTLKISYLMTLFILILEHGMPRKKTLNMMKTIKM